MSISKDDVLKISHLARVSLKEEEVTALQDDLSKILDYINQLSELDVENVDPMSHPLKLENVFREDIIQPSFTQTEALKIAVDQAEGAFKVPKVIE